MLFFLSLFLSYSAYSIIRRELFETKTIVLKKSIFNIITGGYISSTIILYLLNDTLFNYEFFSPSLLSIYMDWFDYGYAMAVEKLRNIYLLFFVGIKEELSKYITLSILYFIGCKTLRTPRHTLMLFFEIGVGFGIMENVFYINDIYNALVRGIYTVGFHGLLTMSVGWGILYLKENTNLNKIWCVSISLMVFGLLHGLYDIMAYVKPEFCIWFIIIFSMIIIHGMKELTPHYFKRHDKNESVSE